MTATFSVTVINQSQLDSPATFTLFATVPTVAANPTYALAWQLAQVGTGNTHLFSWPMTWAFAYAGAGVTVGGQWLPEGTMAANPNAATGCSATFAYNGDFGMTPATGQPTGTTLWVTDAPSIPVPATRRSAVGLTLGGAAACATDAGPNLRQTFTLAPSYAIDDDRYVLGQVVDPGTVAQFQALDFGGGSALTATLNADNTWTVVPTATVDFAALRSPAPGRAG